MNTVFGGEKSLRWRGVDPGNEIPEGGAPGPNQNPGVYGGTAQHRAQLERGRVARTQLQRLQQIGVPAWANQNSGVETVFRPRKRMSSFFLLKWGVQIPCLFSQNQTPRSDTANLEPSEPIFCPQIAGAQPVTRIQYRST